MFKPQQNRTELNRNNIYIRYLLLIIIFISSISACRKEPDVQNTLNSVTDTAQSKIEKAKSLYEIGLNIEKSFTEDDSIYLFYAFILNWDSASVRNSNYNEEFIHVPIILESPFKDTIDASMVFYSDSSGIQMELWFFPKLINTYSYNDYTKVNNGFAFTINDKFKTYNYFLINNGEAYFDSIYFLESRDIYSIDQNSFMPWWPPWEVKIKCPQVQDGGGSGGRGGGVFGSIGDFFGELFDKIGQVISKAGNSGSTNGSSGGSHGGKWSNNGSWSNNSGSSGSGGGSSNTEFKSPTLLNSKYILQISDCEFGDQKPMLDMLKQYNGSEWTETFVQALNYLFTKQRQGQIISFAEALIYAKECRKQNNCHSDNYYDRLGQKEKDAMLVVYNKMVSEYLKCNQEFGDKNSGNVDLGSPELCDCISKFTTENAFEKFMQEYYGLTGEEWELLNLNLNKVEKDWIYQNSWAMKYLIKYIKNCGGNSDPSRPDLGILGNIIRSYLDSDVSKDYFDRYWLGQGDLILNINQFNEIYDETLIRGKIEDTFEGVIYRGQSARKHGARINSGKHLLSIGGYTLYKDLNSLPIGLYDYYDFNWHLGVLIPVDFDGDKTVYDNLLTTIAGCTDRTFLSEWKTRAVNVASLFSSARPYKIVY